ncbi:Sfi1 spindle body protein-domain-containing protein [Lipomyces oligophaga]|uniref:Sfi1 spindle body protein-domain-containing protein n=1 Tax=Lipomyces oligophaga TaxID=45792 RepID=UPI0034CD7C53
MVYGVEVGSRGIVMDIQPESSDDSSEDESRPIIDFTRFSYHPGNGSDDSFTRVLPDLTAFQNDPSVLLDSLSDQDNHILRPVFVPESVPSDLDSYSIADLEILRFIVDYALHSPSPSSNSFLTIFKSYESVLRKKHINPSKDGHYFRLIIKLCRSPGTSWASKFNALLVDLSSSLVQERSELVDRYHQFLSSHIVIPLFQHWHARALVQKQASHTLLRAAIKYDETALKSQALELWYAKLVEYASRERKFQAYLLRSRARSVLRNWRNSLQAQELATRHRASLFTVQVYVGRWRKKLHYIKQLEFYLDEYIESHQTATRAKVLLKWTQALDFVEARAIYDQALLRSALKSWIGRSLNVQHIYSDSIEFCSSRLLRWSFMRWKSRSHTCYRQTCVADDFYRSRRLSAIWQTWTHYAVLNVIADEFVMSANFTRLRDALSSWVAQTELLVLADMEYEHTLLQVTLNRMRQSLREKVLGSVYNKRFARSALYFWVLKERAVLFERVNKRRFMVRVLTRWKRCTKLRMRKDQKLVYAVQKYSSKNLAHKVFTSWYKQLQRYSGFQLDASQKFDVFVSRRFLYRWTQKLTMLQEVLIDAKIYYQQSSSRRVLLKWKSRLLSMQDRRRESKLEEFLARRNRHFCSIFLARWFDRMEYNFELRQFSEDFYEAVDVQLVTRLFRSWRSKTDNIVEMTSAAEEYARSRTMVSKFGYWRDRAKFYIEMNQRADAVREIHTLLYVQDLIREWNMKTIQIGILDSRATIFYDKLVSSGSRLLFARWVDKTRERLSLDESDLDEGDETWDSSYTPTRARVQIEHPFDGPTPRANGQGRSVAFANETPGPGISPRVSRVEQRWERLRNSPMFEGRKKLFTSSSPRKFDLQVHQMKKVEEK